MTGFIAQNAAALAVGLGAASLYHFGFNHVDAVSLMAIAVCGFIGGHLPGIQQPSLSSYRILRGTSWAATLLIPLAHFSYRPTDLLLAWLFAFLFTSALWWIIDRVSLRRDYTHSLIGIILLPLMVTGCAYLALGQTFVIAAFLTSSLGYISRLLVDHLQGRLSTQVITD